MPPANSIYFSELDTMTRAGVVVVSPGPNYAGCLLSPLADWSYRWAFLLNIVISLALLFVAPIILTIMFGWTGFLVILLGTMWFKGTRKIAHEFIVENALRDQKFCEYAFHRGGLIFIETVTGKRLTLTDR